MDTARNPGQVRTTSRRRRWVIGVVVLAIVLAVYGAGLGWFAQRLRSDLDTTIQPEPAAQDTHHRSD